MRGLEEERMPKKPTKKPTKVEEVTLVLPTSLLRRVNWKYLLIGAVLIFGQGGTNAAVLSLVGHWFPDLVPAVKADDRVSEKIDSEAEALQRSIDRLADGVETSNDKIDSIMRTLNIWGIEPLRGPLRDDGEH